MSNYGNFDWMLFFWKCTKRVLRAMLIECHKMFNSASIKVLYQNCVYSRILRWCTPWRRPPGRWTPGWRRRRRGRLAGRAGWGPGSWTRPGWRRSSPAGWTQTENVEEIQFSIRLFALCHLEWFNSTNISLNKQTPKFKFRTWKMKSTCSTLSTKANIQQYEGCVHLKQNADYEPRPRGVVGQEIINQKRVHCLRLSWKQ